MAAKALLAGRGSPRCPLQSSARHPGAPGAGRNFAEKLKGPALGQSRSQRLAEGAHGADMTANLLSSCSSCELTCS